MIGEFIEQVTIERLAFKNASQWIQEEPVTLDQILANVLDRGDKLAILGLSKLWKTFLATQLSVSLASGRPFLGWIVPEPRNVLHCQFEIRDVHFHRRLQAMCRALGVTPSDLGDRLQILNGRGLGIVGVEGIERIKHSIEQTPDYIMIDPYYKIATGVENAAEDAKILLNAFDVLAEETGAAVAYVHHDPKGQPGDRDIRDRGAGSNVIGRDYDACFAMTGHAQNENAVVIDVLLRNYPPQKPLVIEFANAGDGYCFHVCHDMVPEKKTSRTKKEQTPMSAYAPVAEAILNGDEMDVADFKRTFQDKTGLVDSRVKAFMTWAQAGGKPFLLSREERGRGHYKKYVWRSLDN